MGKIRRKTKKGIRNNKKYIQKKSSAEKFFYSEYTEKTKEYYWKKGNSMIGYHRWENNNIKIKKVNMKEKKFLILHLEKGKNIFLPFPNLFSIDMSNHVLSLNKNIEQ